MMTYYIKSGMALAGNAIQYMKKKRAMIIPYNTIIWIYIRKKTGKRAYRLYSIREVGQSTTGDLVLVDEKKNRYIFLEEYLNNTAGSLFSNILEQYNACFAGYDRDEENHWYKNFKQMIQVSRMMQ